MATVRDEAILLRRFPYSESSLVVRVFSRLHGKIGLLARGAHRPKSRFYCVLDHFDTLELEWRHQPGRELMELRRGDILTRRAAIATDLETYRAGAVACELVDLACPTGQREHGTWERLSRCLDELAQGTRPPWEAAVAFELGFLEEHGICPALEACASCGGPAPPPGPVGPAARLRRPCPPLGVHVLEGAAPQAAADETEADAQKLVINKLFPYVSSSSSFCVFIVRSSFSLMYLSMAGYLFLFSSFLY